MRKIVSWVLLGLGGFLVVVALLAVVWAPAKVERTPIDADTVTNLSGSATALPTGGSGDVKAVSVTKSDAKSDDDVAVFVNYTCLVLAAASGDCGDEGSGDDADADVVSVGDPTVFATDRETAESLADASSYIPEGTANTVGLVNKFPFDAEKKTYDVWDGVVREAVPAEFEGTKDLDGLETYGYRYVVDEAEAEITSGVDGTYSMDKTIWVDPITGAIVDQEQHDVRAAGETTLLDVNLSFTDDEVADNVADAKDNGGRIKLVTETVPLIGFVAGPILIVVGLALLLLGRRDANAPAPAGA